MKRAFLGTLLLAGTATLSATTVCWNDPSAIFGRRWGSGEFSCDHFFSTLGHLFRPEDGVACYDNVNFAPPAVVSFHPDVDGQSRIGSYTGDMVDGTVYVVTPDGVHFDAVYRDPVAGQVHRAALVQAFDSMPGAMSFVHVNEFWAPRGYLPVPPFDSLPTTMVTDALFVVHRALVDEATMTFVAIDETGYRFEDLDFDVLCPADLTGTSDPNRAGYGRADTVVDAADFFYYLDQFSAGDLDRADLTGSADPNDPGYGVPDGSIDASDFFYYLDLFEEGCG